MTVEEIINEHLQGNYLAGSEIRKSLAKAIQAHKELTRSQILKAVSEFYQIPVEVIQGQSRESEIIKARHLYCYIACTETSRSLSSIGSLIGGRDHSTVIWARDKVQSELVLTGDRSDLNAVLLALGC